jgi:hypothetical protein
MTFNAYLVRRAGPPSLVGPARPFCCPPPSTQALKRLRLIHCPKTYTSESEAIRIGIETDCDSDIDTEFPPIRTSHHSSMRRDGTDNS